MAKHYFLCSIIAIMIIGCSTKHKVTERSFDFKKSNMSLFSLFSEFQIDSLILCANHSEKDSSKYTDVSTKTDKPSCGRLKDSGEILKVYGLKQKAETVNVENKVKEENKQKKKDVRTKHTTPLILYIIAIILVVCPLLIKVPRK